MQLAQSAIDFLEKIVNDQFNGNIRKAALSLGITYQTLYSWVGNKSRLPSLKVLEPVLDRLNVQFNFPESVKLDFDYIPKVAAKAGAGSSLETSGETIGLYAFRKDYISAQGIHPRSSILLDVVGDSMEPLLKEGDTILVDQADKDVRDGKTYLVAYGEELKVKHVLKSPRGLILRSENTRYADVLIEPEELGTYAVIHGRVRWFGRMM